MDRRNTCASVTIRVAWDSISCPAGVSATVLPARSKSLRPNSCSKLAVRIEIAGWVMQRWSAAAANC